MNEKKGQIIQIVKLLLVVVCASLYAWGGMEHKYLRRFIAPGICGAGIFIVSKNWLQLIKVPLLVVASSLGYGADQTIWKIFKRFYVGLAFGIAGSINHLIPKPKKWAFITWCNLSIVLAFVLLGVFNPFAGAYGARIEDTFLGLIIYANIIMPIGGYDDES